MRALLWVFVLATATVVWIAGMRLVSSRAATRRPDDVATERPREPLEAMSAGGAPSDGEGGAEARTDRAVASIDIAPPIVPPVDAVPVDVILVHGESGDVLSSTTTSVERGPEVTVAFRVSVPGGYVADSFGERQLKVQVSRRAERLRVVEPLRREADIGVRVLDSAGRPVEGAHVTAVLRGGDRPQAEVWQPSRVVPFVLGAASGPAGWLRVRGLPHLLDERYWIVVRKEGAEAAADALLGAFGERRAVEVRLPAAFVRPSDAVGVVGVGGGSGGGYSGHVGSRRSLVASATLEVLVRRKDGRLAAGLEVSVGAVRRTTDGSGRARFEGLPPGTWPVAVRDPDFTWSPAEVELRAGDRRTIVLSEIPGWTARALLLDSTGRPVPFARVEVASTAPVAYLRVEDGVQDVVLFTDKSGEIRVPDLHHAPVTLTFNYGSRFTSVTLEEGEPSATVRLPPP